MLPSPSNALTSHSGSVRHLSKFLMEMNRLMKVSIPGSRHRSRNLVGKAHRRGALTEKPVQQVWESDPLRRRESRLAPSRGACVCTFAVEAALWSMPPSLLPPASVGHLLRRYTICRVLDLSLLCSARLFAFVKVPAIQWLNLTWIRATIDGIVVIQFLLAAQNLMKGRHKRLGQSEDSHSQLSSRRSLQSCGNSQKKAITGLIWLQIIMAVMLFAPPGLSIFGRRKLFGFSSPCCRLSSRSIS